MDREIIEQLKQISAKKRILRSSSEKVEPFMCKKEQDLIRQLDSQRDELLCDTYFKAY